MEVRPIEKNKWEAYFDSVSKVIRGQYAEIEVAGLSVGDQIEESWTSLDGISYEPKEDVLFVHIPSLDHAVHKPREIVAVQNGDLSLKAISIKDADGNVQTVTFRAPLLLGEGREASTPGPAPF